MFAIEMRAASGICVLVAVVVAAVILAISSSSSAAAAPTHGVTIQAIYDQHGNPLVVANFTPDGSLAKARWSICRPPDVSTCTATGSITVLKPGPTPAGTVFEADATYRGDTYSARTATWEGTVHATRPPLLVGRARYGSTVTPRAATWAGGWESAAGVGARSSGRSGGFGPDSEDLRVQACRTRTGRDCVPLSAPDMGFARASATVPYWATGRYLFAYDERTPADTVVALPGFARPEVTPALRAGPTVARSAPAGPVGGPRAPRLRLLRPAIVSHNRLLVARARCAIRCRVSVEVTGRGQSSPETRTTVIGRSVVAVPLGDLRAGPIVVTIWIDDGPLVGGRSRLP